jgi:hypothetical protein
MERNPNPKQARAADPELEQAEVEAPPRQMQMLALDYSIRDLNSFDRVTADPHQVARIYFYNQLDCLIDLAYKISHDFFKRPHLYTDLGPDPVDPGRPFSGVLARFHAQYGVNEYLPSAEQRDRMYGPILGGPMLGEDADIQGSGDGFPGYRDDLIGAAAAFSERVYDTGEEMLRERVRNSHRIFQDYLIGFQGDALNWGANFALPYLTESLAFQVLRNPGVAGVFGIDRAPGPDWPYREDPNGGKLVEAVSRQLVWSDQTDEACLSRERFSHIQRAGLRGAEALATIIDYHEARDERSLDLIIKSCYSWGAALLGASAHTRSALPSSAAGERVLMNGSTELNRPVGLR